MTYPETEIDKIGLDLYKMAEAYAVKAESLASDPNFREAIMRTSVSSFVWALYHAFDGQGRAVLAQEMIEQTEAIQRAVAPTELAN